MMKGEQLRKFWAIVYLFGLIATHFSIQQGILSESVALWVWFFVIAISLWTIRISFGKTFSSEVHYAWKISYVLLIVLTGIMLLGFWPASATTFFALYLILNAASKSATGMVMKSASWLTFGLAYLGLGIVYATWFSQVPFLAAVLIIGSAMTLASWMK